MANTLIIKAPGTMSDPSGALQLPVPADLTTGLLFDFDPATLTAGDVSVWNSKAGSLSTAKMTAYTTNHIPPVRDSSGPSGKPVVNMAGASPQAFTGEHGATLTDPVTFAIMVYIDPASGLNARIIGNGGGATHTLRTDYDKWTLGTGSALGGTTIPTSDGTWVALAYTFNAASTKIKVGSRTPMVVPLPASVGLSTYYVGTSVAAGGPAAAAAGAQFKGKIARYQAWKRAFTDAELEAIVLSLEDTYS
jgi:hypothetical protein